MTYLSSHVQLHDAASMDAVLRMASPIGKAIDPVAVYWQAIKAALPGFKLIARFSGWPWISAYTAWSPEVRARNFIDYCKTQPGWSVADYIETPNEPFGGGGDPALYDLYDRFMAECVRLGSDLDKQVIVGNFGTGNFTPAEWRRFFPRTIAVATCYGFHEYGWPRLWSQNYFTGGGHALRCIAIMQEIRLTNPTAEAFVTECGVTHIVIKDQPDEGYTTREQMVSSMDTAFDNSPESYWEDLKWYIKVLSTHDFIKSAHIFGSGMNPDWATFEIVGTSIIDRAREWNLAQQKEAPVATDLTQLMFIKDDPEGFARWWIEGGNAYYETHLEAIGKLPLVGAEVLARLDAQASALIAQAFRVGLQLPNP